MAFQSSSVAVYFACAFIMMFSVRNIAAFSVSSSLTSRRAMTSPVPRCLKRSFASRTMLCANLKVSVSVCRTLAGIRK